MADEAHPAGPAEAAPAQPAAHQPKAPSKLVLPLAVGAAVLAGSGLGALVLGPRIVSARAAAADAAVEEPAVDSTQSAAHDDGELGGPLLRIENLIVNPAGSQGSRFLMVSIAIETASGATGEHLRSQEPKLRDAIIALLERQTMETLARPGIRDSLKRQLADTIGAIAGGERLRVYLPQFVIQ
jgi:flagellar FliL protein